MKVSALFLIDGIWQRETIDIPGREALLKEALRHLDEASGGKLLAHIADGGPGIELRPMVFVYVNGVNSRFLKGLETLLQDGDSITVGYFFIGG